MRKNLFHIKASFTLILLGCSAMLTGCFTGIESTKQIEVSKQERRLITPGPEELLMDQVLPLPLGKWNKDYMFIISDSKADLILNHDPAASSLKPGEVLKFSGVETIAMPDGKEYARLKFLSADGTPYFYNSGKVTEEAAESVTSDKIPMMVDGRIVSLADSILRGRRVWNRSNMAYDRSGERINVLKFSPLTVDSVTFGEGYFPLKLWTRIPSGVESSDASDLSTSENRREPIFFYLDFNSSLSESRPFRKLFSLSDPKLSYPQISDQVWNLIRAGRIAPGMTKDECKLSLGNPSDVNSGHDYNSTIDLWQYPDGTYLKFIDGVLVSFRK